MASKLHETKIKQAELAKLLDKDVSRLFLNTRTLRLTKEGCKALQSIYEHWVVEPPKKTANNMISLMRKMTFPYYIDKKQLVLFTERDAFMAKLAGAQGWIDGK